MRKNEPKESVIEARLRKKVSGAGGRFYKWVSPGNDGVPDRIAILPGGRIIFVEMKTNRGKLTEIQKYQQEILRKLGCDVATVYGVEGVEGFVERIADEV